MRVIVNGKATADPLLRPAVSHEFCEDVRDTVGVGIPGRADHDVGDYRWSVVVLLQTWLVRMNRGGPSTQGNTLFRDLISMGNHVESLPGRGKALTSQATRTAT
jgi:hypothetical protein